MCDGTGLIGSTHLRTAMNEGLEKTLTTCRPNRGPETALKDVDSGPTETLCELRPR